MRDFNRMMARVISDIRTEEAPLESRRLLKCNGILRRGHIPTWAQNAVFFRERGKCALTRKDLSGLISTLNDAHFDHIVPLSCGGLNDVTNLQLLAANANLGKSNRHDETSLIYERWY
jgi:5-methylcytosine-specific restriction endonuclease McrA